MFKRSLKVLAFATFFWCCCFLSIAQTQNTYLLGLTNDHYSAIESSTTPGNFVHVGTVATSTTSGTHDIHAIEVDGAGNIVWEWIYQTAQDERAFHVDESPNGYIISGYIINNADQPCHVLLLEIDFFGGILQQASYPDNFLDQHSSGLHVKSVAGDPLGGFIVAGLAAAGLQDASSKAGMLLKVDAGLNAQWVQYYESPSGFNDYDMGSHVLEVPNKGYFMSGSCNAANGDQHVYGVMTDYSGFSLWDTEYADNNGNGHTSVAASAIYDAQTDQVIQLCNLSIIHHWGITTYDVTTGARDLNRSFRVFSNLGYANIQGFKLLQAPNPDHLIIAGYMRDHSWPEVDDAGNPTGNTLTGSPPFICEVDKIGTTFLWDNMYLVPSPGYTASTDIFGAFSAGQQPRILHPEMALRKSDGLGYWMNAYNNKGSGQFDIELIELDLVGANPCSAAPLDFTFAGAQWFDENNVDDIAGDVPTFIPGLQAMPITPQLVSCANTSCIPDAAFSITDLGDCCYQFDDLSPLPVGLSCPQTWDIIDLATAAHLCTGTGSSISCCFPISGTYNICYEDCCVDADGNVVTSVHCENLVVDCQGCEVPVFDWSWVSGWDGSADLCPNGGCTIGFNCPTALDGSLLDPDKYCMTWDFGDGTIIAGDLDFCPIHCYADCGIYNACATVYCCEDDSQLLTVCHEVVVDCCCEVPDFDWNWVESGADLCPNGGCAIGFNCPTTPDGSLLDPDKYCITWDFGDGTVANSDVGVCPIHCYADCGIYNACATVYCCEDDSQLLTVCHEVVVDCCEPCALPTEINFSWGSSSGCADCLDGCCVSFDSGLIWPEDGLCVVWDFGDGSAPHTALNDFNIFHCFPGSGTYTVCYTVYCCDDDSQAITVCHDVTVDCGGCDLNEIQPSLDIQQDGCIWTFTVLDLSGNDPDHLCVSGEPFGGAIVPLSQAIWTVDFTGQCTGWGYCFEIFCCEDQPGSGIGICFDGIVDCCCDASFDLTQDECCVALTGSDSGVCLDPVGLATADLNGDGVINILDTQFAIANGCCSYDMGDGTVYNGPGPFTHCYQQSGSYTICHTVCCVLPDGSVQIDEQCQDIDVLCPQCVLPAGLDFGWGPMANPLCTDGCSIGFDCPVLDPDLYCVHWDFGDGNTYDVANSCPIHCYDVCGIYTVCLTIYCCEDDTQSVTICHEVQVDCCSPCDLDPVFVIDLMSDCCYAFSDQTPTTDPNGNDCDYWEIIDASGVTIANAFGDFWQYCFQTSGSYVVCHTDCCLNTDGTQETQTYCQDIFVDCGCPEPDVTNIIAVSDDNCEWGFCAEGDFGSNVHCAIWDFGDGTVENHPLNICPSHQYNCDGNYIVCVTVYCCNDDTISATYCQDIVVDCPCELPQGDFAINTDECMVTADAFLLSPALCIEDYCVDWDWGDGSPTTSGFWGMHTYDADGSYTICMTVYCCEDSSISYTVCHTVTVDCPCTQPELFEIQVVISDDCELGFCAIGDFDFDEHCVLWSWGDGIVENHPLDFCPIHQYTCDGVYEVCATVYCCEDPSISTTVCTEITVNCPCHLPTQADLLIGVDECNIDACVLQAFPTECPEDYCYTWDFGDGTSVVNGGPCEPHSYATSGTYTVCVSIYCCDEPNLPGLVLCQEVTVNCCDLGTPDFDIDIDDCTACFSPTIDGLPVGSDICYDFHFMWNVDASVGTADANPCYTYPESGNYTVCMHIWCCDDLNNIMLICKDITVDCPCDLPSGVDFGVDQTDCTVDVGAIYTDDYNGDLCFQWTFGDGSAPVSGESASHTYSESGHYTICLTICCCDDLSVSITVCHEVCVICPCTLPQVDIAYDIVNCTAYFSVAGITSDIEGICYDWDFGDGAGGSGTNVNHVYATSGTYTVCLTVYCCNDLTTAYTICLQVAVECPACILPSDAGIDCTVNDCTAAFGAFYTDDYTGPLCFIWDFGDGTPPALSEIAAHTYFASGTYTVCLYIHCCNDPSEVMSVCKEVTVECDGQCPEPCELNPAFAWIQDPFTFGDGCCTHFTDLSTAGSATTITSWSWDFGDGTLSDLQNPTHCYAAPGVHTVCLTITGTSPEGDCTMIFCWDVQCGAEDTCPGDLDHDGDTDTADLLLLLVSFGTQCE